jgi:hypothetical protein
MSLSDYAPYHPQHPEVELPPLPPNGDAPITHPEASDILPKVSFSSHPSAHIYTMTSPPTLHHSPYLP